MVLLMKKTDNPNKSKKRSLVKTMDKILLIIGIFLFTYITTMIVIYCITGSYPEVMTHDIIYGCLGEGGIMGVIKIINTIFKNKKKEENKDQTSDESFDYENSDESVLEDISEEELTL